MANSLTSVETAEWVLAGVEDNRETPRGWTQLEHQEVHGSRIAEAWLGEF